DAHRDLRGPPRDPLRVRLRLLGSFRVERDWVPLAYPFETELKDLNPYFHSQNDTIDTIDFNHMADFTKLSIAYVVELTQDSATAC
ncbi:hypothetical protein DYB30_014071, partial [Aphanomyces astaci]